MIKNLKTNSKIIIFMPSMDGGGVEKNIILITNYLVNYYKYISLITFNNKFKKKFSKKIHFISHTSKNTIRSKYYKYFICLIYLFKQIIFCKKVLVFSFQANIYALILCKFLKKKIIIRSNSAPTGWTKNLIKRKIFKFFFKYANSIIVNSKDFKKEIDKEFNINSKLIYNPLNKLEIIKNSKRKINLKFFSKNKKKFIKIINIARFTDQKDQATIIKATNILKSKINIKLLMIGYGEYKEKLNLLVSKYKLNKNVKILGFKKNPYPYLKKSDLFILSSKYEGLPNVLLEAMTLKKFIISSDCQTGPREILFNGKYGDLFKIGDFRMLSRLIYNFNFYKNENKKKINLAYKSLARFDFDKNCKKYLKIINKNVLNN